MSELQSVHMSIGDIKMILQDCIHWWTNSETPIYHKLLLIVLVSYSVVSLVVGIYYGVTIGVDFPYPASQKLWSFNYQPFSPELTILQYGHFLWFVMYPFTLLAPTVSSVAFALTNICLGTVVVWMLGTHVKLPMRFIGLITLIMYSSNSFRHCIGNAQTSILTLFFVTAGMLYASKGHLKTFNSFIILGMGYIRYNFFPPFVTYLMFGKGLRAVLYALIIPITFWLLFAQIFSISLLDALLKPIQTVDYTTATGIADFMTLVVLFVSRTFSGFQAIYFLTPTLLSLVTGYYIATIKPSPLFALALCLIAGLITYFHPLYDFVALLPTFIVGIKYRHYKEGKILLYGIGYFWFLAKVFYHFLVPIHIIVPVNLLVLGIIFIITIKLSKKITANADY